MTAKKTQTTPKWCTSEEAANLLGIDEATLRTWRSTAREDSPPYYKFGGTIRYDRAELLKWIESSRVAN